jgi:hypothetical protein
MIAFGDGAITNESAKLVNNPSPPAVDTLDLIPSLRVRDEEHE